MSDEKDAAHRVRVMAEQYADTNKKLLQAALQYVAEHNARVNPVAHWKTPETIEDCKILAAFVQRFILKEE